MIETNGFHIRNQRGQLSLERNLIKIPAETENVTRPSAVPCRLKSQNLTAEDPRISETVHDGNKRFTYSESAGST